jgi:hypothetical protein
VCWLIGWQVKAWIDKKMLSLYRQMNTHEAAHLTLPKSP